MFSLKTDWDSGKMLNIAIFVYDGVVETATEIIKKSRILKTGLVLYKPKITRLVIFNETDIGIILIVDVRSLSRIFGEFIVKLKIYIHCRFESIFIEIGRPYVVYV